VFIDVVVGNFSEIFEEDSFSVDLFNFGFEFHSEFVFPLLEFRGNWFVVVLSEQY
jgi:hypothetical protein